MLCDLIEFLDELSIQCSNKYFKLEMDELPTLFLELHGSKVGVKERVELVSEIAQSNGALKFNWETDHEKRAKLWKARHEWWYSGLAMEPGKRVSYKWNTINITIFHLPRDLLQMFVCPFQSYHRFYWKQKKTLLLHNLWVCECLQDFCMRYYFLF